MEGGQRQRRNPIEEGPRLFKRGRWWAADLRPWGGKRPTLRDPSKPKGDRTEFKDVARQWAEVYVRRLQTQTHSRQRGIKEGKALGLAAAEYLQHRKTTQAWNTWRNDSAALSHLLAEFGPQRMLNSIDQDELQAWFNRGASVYTPSTLALYAVLIRSFFEWAGHPLQRVTTPVQHEDDPDTLTDDEISKLLACCQNEIEDRLTRVGLATGGRKAELWALEWTDFKQDMRSVRFSKQLAWPSTGVKGLKGKKNRTALVLPGFMDGMPRQRKGLVVGLTPSQDQASVLFRNLLKRAGLYQPRRGMHILRHTYARLGMEVYEWSTEMLRIFLGHQSIASVEIYAHFGEQAAIKLAAERTYPTGRRDA